MKPARVSLVLMIVQVAIVGSIGAQYVYQRWTRPRVWVRAVAPEARSVVSGRYLNLQLIVDGCQSTLPSAKAAAFPRDINGAAVQGPFGLVAGTIFRANLKVQNNRLIVLNAVVDETGREGQPVMATPGKPCDQMGLIQPVPFYIAENSIDPASLNPRQELWMEVTVPKAGPPRPLQLALKENGAWKTIAIQ
jgi:hypothetical protein